MEEKEKENNGGDDGDDHDKNASKIMPGEGVRTPLDSSASEIVRSLWDKYESGEIDQWTNNQLRRHIHVCVHWVNVLEEKISSFQRLLKCLRQEALERDYTATGTHEHEKIVEEEQDVHEKTASSTRQLNQPLIDSIRESLRRHVLSADIREQLQHQRGWQQPSKDVIAMTSDRSRQKSRRKGVKR